MSRSGWDKDGSGLDVYRCRGKTYCPKAPEQKQPGKAFAKYAAQVRRTKQRIRHGRHGGPAEKAKKKWRLKDRRWRRRVLAKHMIKPLPTNPVTQDTRYHMRKRFEGRPARAQ